MTEDNSTPMSPLSPPAGMPGASVPPPPPGMPGSSAPSYGGGGGGGALDFSLDIPALDLGIKRAKVVDVSIVESDGTPALVVKFQLTEGGQTGAHLSLWTKKGNRGDLLRLTQAVRALGVATERSGGSVQPVGGWRKLVGANCKLALSEYNGKLSICRFGYREDDQVPEALKRLPKGSIEGGILSAKWSMP